VPDNVITLHLGSLLTITENELSSHGKGWEKAAGVGHVIPWTRENVDSQR